MSYTVCVCYRNTTCSNHYHIVKLLLDEGSDVNAADREGHAPIHIATVWGYYRILSLILSHPNCQIDIPVST